jgi:nucleobase:cation symporter-1, NCS1 family
MQEQSAHIPVAHERDSGPTHTGDIGVEWRGLQPVPDEKRYGKAFRMAPLWFSAQLSPIAFFIGVIGTASYIGLGWWQNVLAIVLGNALGAAGIAALSLLGPPSGAPQMILARLPFGKGITLVGLIAYIESIVFIALGAIFGAQALQVAFHFPFALALLLVFVLEGLISVIGYEFMHRFEQVMVVAAGLAFFLVMIKVITHGGVHVHQVVHGGAAVGSFILMTAIAFGFAFGWAINATDYCRYLPSDTPRRSLFGWVFGGLFVGCVWLEIVGLAAGSLLPSAQTMHSIYVLLGGGALGFIAMLTLYLGVVAQVCVEDYSGGLQVLCAGVRLPRPVISGFTAAIAFGVTYWLSTGNLLSKAENLVLLSTYWVGPFVAIIAIDWWRRTTFNPDEVASYQRLTFRPTALIALIVGFLASLPFSDTTLGAELAAHGGVLSWLFGWVSTNLLHGGDIAYYVGIIVGGVVYAALERAAGREVRLPHRRVMTVTGVNPTVEHI